MIPHDGEEDVQSDEENAPPEPPEILENDNWIEDDVDEEDYEDDNLPFGDDDEVDE